jgi:hypothetical protein
VGGSLSLPQDQIEYRRDELERRIEARLVLHQNRARAVLVDPGSAKKGGLRNNSPPGRCGPLHSALGAGRTVAAHRTYPTPKEQGTRAVVGAGARHDHPGPPGVRAPRRRPTGERTPAWAACLVAGRTRRRVFSRQKPGRHTEPGHENASSWLLARLGQVRHSHLGKRVVRRTLHWGGGSSARRVEKFVRRAGLIRPDAHEAGARSAS